MKTGNHLAKIVDYGLVGNKAGDGASVFVKFLTKDEGDITWFGSLKEGKAFEITFGNLLDCGYTGLDPSELEKGMESQKLITTEEIPIYVDKEVNHLGREIMRVKRIGEGKQLERLGLADIKTRVKTDKIKIQAMELLKTKKPRVAKNQLDDIDF